jgi:hypothetical protein
MNNASWLVDTNLQVYDSFDSKNICQNIIGDFKKFLMKLWKLCNNLCISCDTI